MDLGLLLLLSVIGLAFIMAGSSAYFIFFMKRIVFRQLQDLDHVRSTGFAPERWQRGYLAKAKSGGGINPRRWKRQKRKNLRRLAKLTRFAKTTRLMEDDDTRSGVLQELKDIRETWAAEKYPEGMD